MALFAVVFTLFSTVLASFCAPGMPKFIAAGCSFAGSLGNKSILVFLSPRSESSHRLALKLKLIYIYFIHNRLINLEALF